MRLTNFFTAVVLLSVVYLPLAPWLPADGLDPSWLLGIAYALSKGLHFGSDLTFTYGPLGGLLFRAAWGGGMVNILLLWVPLLLGAAVAVHLCFREHSMWAVALALAPLLLIKSFDAIGLYIMFAVACAAPAVARDTRIVCAFSGLFALLALCKFTFAAASCIALAPVACYRLVAASPRDIRAYLPWILFPLAWLGSWVLIAGQDVSDFGSYVRRSYTIARAYSSAMAIEGPSDEVWLGAGVLVGLIFTASLLVPSLPRRPLQLAEVAPVVHALAVATLAWLAFKQGFVRHDAHVLAYVSFAGVALGTLWRVVPSPIPAWNRRLFSASAALWVLLALKGSQHHLGGVGLLEGFLGQLDGRLAELRSAWQSDEDRRAQFRAALDRIRQSNPLPRVAGRVDVASVDIARALANGLDWRPRPIFQSYSVYSPALARANEAYVADPARAPEHYFVNLAPVDHHAPLQEDPLLWPQLLTRFEPRGIDSALHMQRRKSPRPESTRTLTVKHRDGFWHLPDNLDQGYVLLKAAPRRGLAQKLASILLRSPAIHLEMRFRDGHRHRVRHIDSLESTPFILSPFVRTNYDFMLLSATPKTLGRVQVVAFRFVDDDGEELPMRARPSARLVTLGDAPKLLPRPKDPRVPVLPEIVQGPDDVYVNPVLSDGGRHVINAHSPATLSFEATADSYKLCFGIRDGVAWKAPDFDGVRYTIRGDASPEPLLDRLLTPKGATPTPREECHQLSKPSGAKKLLLETLPNGTANYDWAYWTVEPV